VEGYSFEGGVDDHRWLGWALTPICAKRPSIWRGAVTIWQKSPA
jgi:hypothetical protein